MNPFVDLARVAEMAVVERVGEDEMAHPIDAIGFAIPTDKAIFRQKVRNIHDPVGAGREHFKRLSDDRSILAVNNDRLRTRIVLIPNWSATRHDSHPDFLAKTPLCIFRKRVHEVFALPKRNLQHEFALRRGLKPKLRELESLDLSHIHKINELASVHAVARKSIRMPTDDAARFLFFYSIHHGVENGTSGDFGRLFLDKLLDYKQSLASGILPKLGQLGINRQNLFVLNIGRLARI